ncbi:MAG: tRNA (adenosine(37)-N6)-dimethylallyltransferase MiaA [Clostridiales bacterium]|nr:tRNA (adenosine(37)-N6)-dimethylallyltransferase MiaA [Clostridiales bacterium]
MERKPTCWVLSGPTASGKTALSIRLAKAHNCEIVCMDSMQIYRRMTIGTAKPTPEEMDGVPHHMIDVAAPDEPFSVARYQEMAEAAMADIISRGRKPLLVGGTGLYLRALRHPMGMGMVAGDDAIREALENEAKETDGRFRLHRRLSEVDPDAAARLHVNDVRRVVRALEVYQLTGVPFSKQPQVEAETPFRYRVATLTMDREKLYQRIEKRVDMMLEAGLIGEVRALLESGVPADAQAMKGLGYKELVPYLRGECTLDKAVYELKLGTRHYAKRQLTWMRREEDVLWVDSLQPDAYEKLEAWFMQGEEV